MSPCQRGFDADLVASAMAGDLSVAMAAEFDAHVDACPACTLSVRARTLVKTTWRRDVTRDEMYTRPESEHRIAAKLVRRRRTVSPWLSTAFGAALGAALVAFLFVRHPRVEGEVTAQPSPPKPAPAPAPEEPKTTPSTFQAARRPKTIVAERACPECTGHVNAGVAIAVGEPIDVPRGATLLLNWAMVDGLVEPGAGVELSGPATVRAGTEGEPVLLLSDGVARVRARNTARIRTEQVMVRGKDASWTMRVFAGSTTIEVTGGEIEVGDRTLRAGEKLRVPTDEPRAALAPPLPPPLVPAQTDAGSGEDGTLAQTQAIAKGVRDAERKSFARAEIDLSHGAVEDARERLYPLVHASDPSLAGDATFLLARSLTVPRDRAELLARYLGFGPPSPYREQALLERALALLADGDVTGARTIARDLRGQANLPSFVLPGLQRLEMRLGGG